MALIEEEKPKFISPELREGWPASSKHNDAMPDKAYDKVAEKNLFPPAAYEVGAGPKPKPLTLKEAKKGPKPAAKGRKGRKHRKSRKAKKHGKKSRKGGKKGRKHRKSGRKGRKGGKRGRKGGKGRKGRKGGKKDDPRSIVTPPFLQDIWDARHKHFIKGTNSLLNEVDDGLLEHMIYPKIADPNKKKCKKKKGSKAKKTSSKKSKKSKKSSKKF